MPSTGRREDTHGHPAGIRVIPLPIFQGLELLKGALVGNGVVLLEDHEHSASFKFKDTKPSTQVLLSLHPSDKVHIFSRRHNQAGSVESLIGKPWCVQLMFTREEMTVGLPEVAGFGGTMSAQQFAIFLLRTLIVAWSDRYPDIPFPLRGRPLKLGEADPILPEALALN